jgi:hypothetical protein
MAKRINAQADRLAAFEPLHDVNPLNGVGVEVFYADAPLARSFGKSIGWYWWTCRRGFMPDGEPAGPFGTRYAAYRSIASRWTPIIPSFGRRRH